MIIIGIDPGTSRAGYGLIKKENGRLSFLAGGILKSSSQNQAEKLLEIQNDLKKIIAKYKPSIAGIEKLYFMKNQKTALAVAEARGVILFTFAASKISILEFDPTEVKSSIAGSGCAGKKEVQKTVELILKEKIKGVDDISDALAIAILASSPLYKIT
ncbi:MAG: crossover junction endodeoxyribonuclease RuvC [Candidatus Liptonbacteria bacterium RIFOXYC1_FULL_36_8]|uniref:Crossover junction endodeoxyribonuclease RuvC n=3 Tax=Candidatus Liptoniibacteriota TaxID=1817909 RepID=A0A1G2CMR2_9BACT|nr:MAG: crossover junction endodeoxyribonuclease RuvC [Candidatus Liptonbacteria bacterium RIFOXYB1_FULL_36_10]OGZ02949.1 MAG: crossover junction endodeoxyribonuclease RuvC [Candidatus Liptonbacteria bacterium RIFOXYC1_FULL_36_8]OGZ03307.1 MAG: crossover junction endodeoxyribonuclease RuvC [Candidatus Liptonbacteria bacterium RIFOXYD1_FULL_36_11]